MTSDHVEGFGLGVVFATAFMVLVRALDAMQAPQVLECRTLVCRGPCAHGDAAPPDSEPPGDASDDGWERGSGAGEGPE